MSYKETFITVAPDCPVSQSEIPVSKRAIKPLHIIQYELLTENPYTFDHKELVFNVHLIRKGLEDLSESEKEKIWDDLFVKGHPCLRASALTNDMDLELIMIRMGKLLFPQWKVVHTNHILRISPL